MVRRGNYRRHFGQRLGLYSAEDRARLAAAGGPVWVQAVSVGEMLHRAEAGRRLARRPPGRRPRRLDDDHHGIPTRARTPPVHDPGHLHPHRPAMVGAACLRDGPAVRVGHRGRRFVAESTPRSPSAGGARDACERAGFPRARSGVFAAASASWRGACSACWTACACRKRAMSPVGPRSVLGGERIACTGSIKYDDSPAAGDFNAGGPEVSLTATRVCLRPRKKATCRLHLPKAGEASVVGDRELRTVLRQLGSGQTTRPCSSRGETPIQARNACWRTFSSNCVGVSPICC